MVEAANNDAELMVLHCVFLSPQSKEVAVQLQEDLMKVLNELYTVRETTDNHNHNMWIHHYVL